MTWGNLKEAFKALPDNYKYSSKFRSGDGTHTADILLQIVLPIVLILAFFAFTSVKSYETKKRELEEQQLALDKQKYEEMLSQLENKKTEISKERENILEQMNRLGDELKKINLDLEELHKKKSILNDREFNKLKKDLEEKQKQIDQEITKYQKRKKELDSQASKIDERTRELKAWWQEISQSEKAKLVAEIAEAHIELQKQKIIVAFEKVQIRRKSELGIFFLAGKQINIGSSGQLIDDHDVFSKTCYDIYNVFQSDKSFKNEADTLYIMVLKEAGLTDIKHEISELGLEGYERIIDSEKALKNQITTSNKSFLMAEIDKFMDNLRKEVLREQVRVINTFFQFYESKSLDERYKWNPKLKELKDKMVSTTDSVGVGLLENELIVQMYEKLKIDLEKQGYKFLGDAWSTL